MPGSPILSTTSTANSTIGSVRDARTMNVAASTTAEGSALLFAPVTVPLFDPQSPLRPLRAELLAAIERVVDGGQFVLGPEVEAFERELRGVARRAARGRRGQRDGGDHDRPARPRRRPGRRGRRALLHLLRERRGDPAHGRHAGLLRRRPADVVRHRRHGEGRAHAAHEGDRRRRPLRQRRADPRDRGARAAGHRGRRAGRGRRGRRRRAGGHARHARDVLLLPVEEPRRLRRRRRGDRARRRARRPRPHAALPRLARQGHLRAGRLQQPPRRGPGGRSCACCCPTSTAGPSTAAPWRAGTRRRGCPGPATEPGAKPAWHLHVVRDERPDEASARLAAAGVQSRGYYRAPGPRASRRCGRTRRASRSRRRTRRADAPRPADERLAHPRAGERGRPRAYGARSSARRRSA